MIEAINISLRVKSRSLFAAAEDRTGNGQFGQKYFAAKFLQYSRNITDNPRRAAAQDLRSCDDCLPVTPAPIERKMLAPENPAAS
jgi:hypothetical protein